MDNERRQYHRVNFDSIASLSANDQSFDCQIIDLSIHGVLLRPHGVLYVKEELEYQLIVPLDTAENKSEQKIEMAIKLVRQNPDNIAFKCENLDLDSITHLRKIIELNSGDPSILERDMKTLCEENE